MSGSLQQVRDYESISRKQWEALGNKCGGPENVRDILTGDLEVTLQKAVRLLVDSNGRCIPQPAVTDSVRDQDNDFSFGRLPGMNWPGKFDWECILDNWASLFCQPSCLAVADCKTLLEALKRTIATWPNGGKPQIASLLKGPWFPVLLPKVSGDYGAILEKFCLPALAAAYKECFPQRRFSNITAGTLAHQVEIQDERHGRLMADLAKGQIFGIVCYPLQGFSVLAQRQMVSLMPDFISLIGPYEASVATAMHLRHLARDLHTPAQECSAVAWHKDWNTLHFTAFDDGLSFSQRVDLNLANSKGSGGFFIRGSRPMFHDLVLSRVAAYVP